MKHLKIYEDYSDEEIDSLFSDLEKIGQVKSAQIVCRVKCLTPQQLVHPSWWKESHQRFAIVNVPDRGTDETNKRLALEKIKKGDFQQKLEDLTSEESEVLKKENVQKAALSSSTLEDFLSRVSTPLVETVFRRWEELVEEYLKPKSQKDVEEFFQNGNWRSSPKKAWSEILGVMDPEIRIIVK
jgi:hypothetical protein